MASRMDLMRQRVNIAEGKPAVEKKSAKKVEDADEKKILTEEEQEQSFLKMLFEYDQMRAGWRLGFYMLPLSVGAFSAYMLMQNQQKPWAGEAQHFVPFKNHLNAGQISFGLAIHVMVCVLSMLGNFLVYKPLMYIALALSLVPALIFGSPFAENVALWLTQGSHAILLWCPLASVIVAGCQVGVEHLWDAMLKDMRGYFDRYKYANKSA